MQKGNYWIGRGKVPLYAAYREFVTENICVDWNNSIHKNEYLDYEIVFDKGTAL